MILSRLYTIARILAVDTSRLRISFILPFIGIIISSFMIILIDSIMNAMEKEIFSNLNEVTNRYSITNFKSNEEIEIQNYLKSKNINYKVQYKRDIIISNGHEYAFAKLILTEDSLSVKDELIIGNGVASHLNISILDSVTILSPLDIKFSSLKVPSEDYIVDSIYHIPVIDFDETYIYLNTQNILKFIVSQKEITLDDSLSLYDTQNIKNKCNNVKIDHWMDEYSVLLSAIKLEKTMYLSFALMLLLISCLGNFTVTSYIVTNKVSSFKKLHVLGLNVKDIKNKLSIILVFLSLVSTLFSSLLAYSFINSYYSIMLVDELFPLDLFYEFNLEFNFYYTYILLFINIIIVYLSSLFAVKTLDITE